MCDFQNLTYRIFAYFICGNTFIPISSINPRSEGSFISSITPGNSGIDQTLWSIHGGKQINPAGNGGGSIWISWAERRR